MESLRVWVHDWWITLRYGSRFTKAGRTLRRHLDDDPEAYVEVQRPEHSAEKDARCPKCIEKWGQVPSAWGDSASELDAYDEHLREHVTSPDGGNE